MMMITQNPLIVQIGSVQFECWIDRSPCPMTEGSLEPEVFDDTIDPEDSRSELENRVDKLDVEID